MSGIPDKEFKARYKASANSFVKKMQSNPELLIKYRNYEETKKAAVIHAVNNIQL